MEKQKSEFAQDDFSEMYSKLPNLVLAFHGCSKETFEHVIVKRQGLAKSENKYDWLGNGIYFWEHSYQSALEWAESHHKGQTAVIGAVLDLGHCLNLTDYQSADILKIGYELLDEHYKNINQPLPQNRKLKNSKDILLHDLDCAVIEQIHLFRKENNLLPFDSVRGIFFEGDSVYPQSCFYEKTHIQICITNPNCIKGYFSPIQTNKKFSLP